MYTAVYRTSVPVPAVAKYMAAVGLKKKPGQRKSCTVRLYSRVSGRSSLSEAVSLLYSGANGPRSEGSRRARQQRPFGVVLLDSWPRGLVASSGWFCLLSQLRAGRRGVVRVRMYLNCFQFAPLMLFAVLHGGVSLQLSDL